MSGDTPALTEAEWSAIWLDIPGDGEFRGVRRAIDRVLAARVSTATGDTAGDDLRDRVAAGDDVAIRAQNPDVETAWRTIARWDWQAEAQKGYAIRDAVTAGDDLRDRVTALAEAGDRETNWYGHTGYVSTDDLRVALSASSAPVVSRPEAEALAALDRVRALWGGGDHPPVFLSDRPNKIVRCSVKRPDLGATVTESFLRVDDVVRAASLAAVPEAGA